MVKMVRLQVIMAALLLVPVIVVGQGYVEQVSNNGSVNWTQQVMRATGIGAPNPNLPLPAQRASAITAAKMDALRNLIAVVKGVNLTAETTVENAMVASDVINSKVEGAIRGFRILDTRYMTTGDIEVEVEVPITGIVLDALLPGTFGGGALATGAVCPTCGQPLPPGSTVAGAPATGYQAAASGVVTGLVVDARGLGVRPAMAPKVVDEQGQEVYGSKYVSREYAVDIGMVGYEKDIERARTNERVTNSPLIVKAVKASGPNKTDVVVSAADVARIHSAA